MSLDLIYGLNKQYITANLLRSWLLINISQDLILMYIHIFDTSFRDISDNTRCNVEKPLFDGRFNHHNPNLWEIYRLSKLFCCILSYLWCMDTLANTAEAVWKSGWSVYVQAKHKQGPPKNMIITEESGHVNTLHYRNAIRFHTVRWNPFIRYGLVSLEASWGSHERSSRLGHFPVARPLQWKRSQERFWTS